MSRSIVGLLFLLSASFLFYFMKQKNTSSAFPHIPTPTLRAHSHAAPAHKHAHHRQQATPASQPVAVKPPPLFSPSPQRPETAVSHMNSLLKTYALGSFTLNDVIEDLEKRKMEPLLLKDSNPHTGTMYVLRTDSPIPGTRYFHAQYFTDDKREPYLQHMSFDVQPKPNAFQESISAIKKIFGNLQAPIIKKKDFIMWPWKKGYNVWIQQLDKDDLSGDPYNAYAANDVGTIKIAVELDTLHHH